VQGPFSSSATVVLKACVTGCSPRRRSSGATRPIEDLQSTNSTKVNGKRIRSVELNHGDEIQIGHTRFRFLTRDE
jgi:pSer/pThr/pTyr-binding forkhead associated (FHA) protein